MIPTDWKRKLAPLAAEYTHASRQVEDESKALIEAKARVAAALEAQALVQAVAEAVQEQVHKQIADVASRCLSAVFGIDAYGFRLRFERKRGRTEARLLFVRDGNEVDPASASGCGPVDVACLALRLAALSLSRPRQRRLIVADEPMRFLHGERYQENMAELIMALAKEMKIQFLISTGCSWLKIGKIIEIGGDA